MKVKCTLVITDPRLRDSPLVRSWREAMQQEIEKTLNESFDTFVREELAAQEMGFRTGAYHMDRATFERIKDEGLTDENGDPVTLAPVAKERVAKIMEATAAAIQGEVGNEGSDQPPEPAAEESKTLVECYWCERITSEYNSQRCPSCGRRPWVRFDR